MTISNSKESAEVRPRADDAPARSGDVPTAPVIDAVAPRGQSVTTAEPSAAAVALPPPRTLWGRFIILALCLAVVLSSLAFGTVHSWALAIFQAGAGLIVALWIVDAWRTGVLRFSKNLLQLPLAGLALIGLVQLLPLGGDVAGAEALAGAATRTLTLDPQATRVAVIQIVALFVYFAAALAFIDTPKRLRLVVRVVIMFGFVLAVFGLMQHFLTPYTIYWVRRPEQAQPFGPYVNRHHFAGYMELVLALPLGLLLAGAVDRDRIPLYAFATALACIALVMTNSRGGIISMVAEIFFLVLVAGAVRRRGEEGEERKGSRLRSAAARVGMGGVIVFVILLGVLYFGGEESLSRLVGTVNADDPTTGRAHFWQGTVEMIKNHPVLGVGLGAFSAAYPRYDTGSGAYRLEQAHNDYLQILSDAGVVGGALGLIFIVVLFRMAFARMRSKDKFRRGVALGAITGCVGVLVHSFFDFTLHTTANALLFLLLAALATMNGRVEEVRQHRRRRGRRRSSDPSADAAITQGNGRERAAA